MNSERVTLAIQMVSVAVLSLGIVSVLPLTDTAPVEDANSRTDSFLDSRLNGQQLQVLPGNGRPSPIDIPLQSSGSENNQETQGGLQEQDDAILQEQEPDSIQPSATVDDLPEDYNF